MMSLQYCRFILVQIHLQTPFFIYSLENQSTLQYTIKSIHKLKVYNYVKTYQLHFNIMVKSL